MTARFGRGYHPETLSAERLETYRKMTPAERWREVEALPALAWEMRKSLPHEAVERRLKYDREQHDRADAIVLAHLRKYP